MSVLHTDLFPLGFPLLQRIYFSLITAAPVAIAAPYDAAYIRAMASGAGGFKDDAPGWGGGAAWAFTGETCAGGDVFTVQVGDSQHARVAANDALGDSWVKRPNGTALVYADRGRPNGTGGLVANSTGSVLRAGSAATGSAGGASAGDDSDPFPLGFGGRGATETLSAWYGGGGGRIANDGAHKFLTFPPADGLLCVEFYLFNPGLE